MEKTIRCKCGRMTTTRRKTCSYCRVRFRRHLTKLAGVKMLGGKCSKCGYDEHLSALEFHHTSDDKESNIGRMYNKSWDVVKKEIEKCVLLCSNCHRIEHTKEKEEEFYESLKSYNGKLKKYFKDLV